MPKSRAGDLSSIDAKSADWRGRSPTDSTPNSSAHSAAHSAAWTAAIFEEAEFPFDTDRADFIAGALNAAKSRHAAREAILSDIAEMLDCEDGDLAFLYGVSRSAHDAPLHMPDPRIALMQERQVQTDLFRPVPKDTGRGIGPIAHSVLAQAAE